MTFTSPAFLFALLPLTVAVFALLRSASRPSAGILVLTAASLVFYAAWDIRFLPLLILSAIANFLFAARIHAAVADDGKRIWLLAALFVDLGALAFFKYAAFGIGILRALTGIDAASPDIVLPLGISFFTFTQIAYLVDVYRKKAHESSFLNYLLFVAYFPHLIAGPILHHAEMMPQFKRSLLQPLRSDRIAVGLTILAIGLAKKLLLADEMALYANPTFELAAGGTGPGFIDAWSAVLAYTLQIYFDFSGYCDMAIGLSFMFGIRLPLNFNSPYKADSVIEFWRRWHMTLSRFLRDYLYIPLGGGRRGQARRYANLFLVMFLGGLWHGAGWTFVAWGCLHGAFLIVNHLWRSSGLAMGRVPGMLLTFFAVAFAWTLFRADSVESALLIIKGLTGFSGFTIPVEWLRYPVVAGLTEGLGLSVASLAHFRGLPALVEIAALLLVVWFMPNSQQILARFNPALEKAQIEPWCWRPNLTTALVVSILLVLSIERVVFQPSTQFLYFQF
jgi:D-alanyl-lipoteichoic acid acyltransferase DltB (MBOAT superfamily)